MSPLILEIISLVDECIEILLKNRGQMYMPTLGDIRDALTDETVSEEERIADAARLFRDLSQHRDGLFDFYIGGDTVEARIEANARLKLVRKRLWELLCK